MDGPAIDTKKQIPHESNKIIYIFVSMTKEKDNKQIIIMTYIVFMGKKTMFVLIIK